MSTREERLGKVVSVMQDIQKDCEAEAMALDGQPFTGATVATQFGNMLAEISGVARAVEVLAEEISRGDG